jgi:uroporphyrin-III C-methyltransferase
MSAKSINPRVTLVGAGPGDPDLISLKGLKALWEADIVLYDALVNKKLLEHVPDDVPAVFVGKRYESHSHSQEEINKLIVSAALGYGHVVRLKGGDPFVFGRGHEELVYVQSYNIPTTIVPGISSAIAVPELQNIPLTKRGISESFWVLTGTTKTGELSADIHLAAQSNATSVILMGVHKLPEIARIFQQSGKGNTAVAVIQNGSLPGERIVTGRVNTITSVVEAEKIGSPAIIVIGDVVKEQPDLWREMLSERELGN